MATEFLANSGIAVDELLKENKANGHPEPQRR